MSTTHRHPVPEQGGVRGRRDEQLVSCIPGAMNTLAPKPQTTLVRRVETEDTFLRAYASSFFEIQSQGMGHKSGATGQHGDLWPRRPANGRAFGVSRPEHEHCALESDLLRRGPVWLNSGGLWKAGQRAATAAGSVRTSSHRCPGRVLPPGGSFSKVAPVVLFTTTCVFSFAHTLPLLASRQAHSAKNRKTRRTLFKKSV